MERRIYGELEIRNVEPSGDWDKIVKHDGGQIFASSAFLRLLQCHLPGSEPHHLAAFLNGEMVAVMPAMKMCVKNLGCVSNSSPFYGSHGGVYTKLKDEKRRECVKALLESYKLECKSSGCITSNVVEPLGNKDYSLYREILQPWKTDNRISQLIKDIVNDEDQMMSRYQSKTRNMVRKAIKEGIKVRQTQKADSLGFLYQVHTENMLAIGGRPKSKSFFDLILTYLEPEKDWTIFEAYIGTECISSLLVLFFGDNAEYFTPVICSNYRSAQPMSLIVHFAILESAKRGYKYFNFGGTWKSQEGVYRFKKRWDATDIPYTYYINKYVENAIIFKMKPSTLLDSFYGYYIYPM